MNDTGAVWRRGRPCASATFCASPKSPIWPRRDARQLKDDAPERVRLKISVYNDAEVPTDVLDRAEEQAEQVFQRSGIEV